MEINLATIKPDVFAFFVSFLTVMFVGKRVIAGLRALKFGQNINMDAPSRHLQKQGTPTMGGVLIVLGIAVMLLAGVLFSGTLRFLGAPLVVVTLVFAAHAALGFADDFLKARRGKSLGLKARQKLAGQILIALLFVGWLYLTAVPEVTTRIWYWRGAQVDLGYLYYALAVIWMVGISNAANLTDGLDGLLGGLGILAALGLSWTIYSLGDHQQLPLFGYALAGGCLGFLWFNAHPAKVFMGDTGSLAIGGGLAAMAIVGKQEILLLVFSAVFLMEIFSVIIQVLYFKATGGRRVFRMTPIHHHFELLGWEETAVVTRFWILGALALALGLLLAPVLSPWLAG